MTPKNFSIAILCGGPSLERGISLNSARSAMDHLESDKVDIVPIYFDEKKKAYKISKAELYSNTPSDFDFKLAQKFSPLSKKTLIRILKSVDIVLPAMHGPFGDDGEIQAFLEKSRIPFVGSESKACKNAFDKYNANKTMSNNGFYTVPVALLKIYSKDNKKAVENFFKQNKIKKVIVKPASGGSSIGVFSAESPKEALEKANIIFKKRIDTRVVVEQYAEGREFTVIILENKLGMSTALMATEIEPFKEGQIFDYRKKYLPTNQVKYHYPARFDWKTNETILFRAEQIFKMFGLRDFARFDGWVLNNGEIWFSDFNPISGMEQNSFLFQQASRIGMSHRDLLRFVIRNSCRRQGVNASDLAGEGNKNQKKQGKKKPVAVLFGGANSERQVSLMTGTNVWLKLLKSKVYEPKPYLLDFDGNVWALPYSYVLNHTVEEIIGNAEHAEHDRHKIEHIREQARLKLLLGKEDISEEFFLPKKMSLSEFVKGKNFIFIGLHGGDGENGNLQKLLHSKKIKYNGSDEKVSRLCMDKFDTGEYVRGANIPGVHMIPQKVYPISSVKKSNIDKFWAELKKNLGAKTIIVKPRSDGCSTGVVHLYAAKDLEKYLSYIEREAKCIPAGKLSNQDSIVELPTAKIDEILFEKFIETDIVSVAGNKLKHIRKSGWVEVTIGVLEEKGKMHAMNPSLTVAEGEVLSLEEKFQGGTGINLTPMPKEIATKKVVEKARKYMEKLVDKIGLRGYGRGDSFINITTGELMIIEVNTVPGLTPSTVFYHQALAENPPLYPVQVLEKIIKNSGY